MDEQILALDELAKAVAADLKHKSVVQRRIRHWTLANALPTVGGTYTGTGKHRRYAKGTIYLAAVLNRLADWGCPIKLISAVADDIATMLPKDARRWEQAIAGGESIYLDIFGGVGSDDPDSAIAFISLKTAAELAHDLEKGLRNSMLINLTTLFREVRA